MSSRYRSRASGPQRDQSIGPATLSTARSNVARSTLQPPFPQKPEPASNVIISRNAANRPVRCSRQSFQRRSRGSSGPLPTALPMRSAYSLVGFNGNPGGHFPFASFCTVPMQSFAGAYMFIMSRAVRLGRVVTRVRSQSAQAAMPSSNELKTAWPLASLLICPSQYPAFFLVCSAPGLLYRSEIGKHSGFVSGTSASTPFKRIFTPTVRVSSGALISAFFLKTFLPGLVQVISCASDI